jgi:hypothetical protein
MCRAVTGINGGEKGISGVCSRPILITLSFKVYKLVMGFVIGQAQPAERTAPRMGAQRAFLVHNTYSSLCSFGRLSPTHTLLEP